MSNNLLSTQLESIFKNSPDAMFLLEGEYFINANVATVKMFGVSSIKVFLSMHPSAFSPEYQKDGIASHTKAVEVIKLAYKNGFHRFEWLHQTLNEEVFDVEVTLTRIEDDGKELLLAQLRYIPYRLRDT